MKKLLVLSLSFFVLFSMSVMAQDDDQFIQNRLSEIQQTIDESKGEWTVGDNPIARLSEAAFRNMLMPMTDEPNPPEFYGIERLPEPLSSKGLYANHSLKQYMTSVKNQGSCGSCWAFAAVGAFEGTLKMSSGKSYDLSEQLLVSSCCSAGDCRGGWPGEVASFINSTGVPEESCYPYRAADSACSEACSGWQQKAIKSANTYSVSQSVSALKSAIQNHGPVHLAYVVMPDFRYYSGGIYKWNGSGSAEGKHAVVAVGFNDANGGYFTVKNSWGSGWGESGYFKIAYSEVTGQVQFGQMANVFGKTNPGPGPSPDPDPNSCKGHCDGRAPGGCYCDSSCAQYGDCCADKVQQCGF